MQVIGIKELQTNPGKLTKAFQDNDYLLITKHGQPLGLALPFAEGVMEQGLLPWFAIKGFQSGDLSLDNSAKHSVKINTKPSSYWIYWAFPLLITIFPKIWWQLRSCWRHESYRQ